MGGYIRYTKDNIFISEARSLGERCWIPAIDAARSNQLRSLRDRFAFLLKFRRGTFYAVHPHIKRADRWRRGSRTRWPIVFANDPVAGDFSRASDFQCYDWNQN